MGGRCPDDQQPSMVLRLLRYVGTGRRTLSAWNHGSYVPTGDAGGLTVSGERAADFMPRPPKSPRQALEHYAAELALLKAEKEKPCDDYS